MPRAPFNTPSNIPRIETYAELKYEPNWEAFNTPSNIPRIETQRRNDQEKTAYRTFNTPSNIPRIETPLSERQPGGRELF